MRIEFKSDHEEAIITLIERRWFKPLRKVKWRGSCTVWHNAETGSRASTHIETRLYDIWTKARWSMATQNGIGSFENGEIKMNSMMQTYKNITQRGTKGKSPIEGKEFVVMEQCKNDHRSDQLALIPAGTEIIGGFAGDFGCYAMAEVQGVIYRVKFDANELHKINWGSLDARNL